VTLELFGHVPSKKNQWRPRKGGGIRLDRRAKAPIEFLIAQAQFGWRMITKGAPLEHPKLTVQFFVRDQRADRDNKLSTLLDVLQEAGVLVDDNIRRCNGVITLLPAIVREKEGVTIEIE
jgi:Holliday junction resolvase RusA-like endonuclease